MRDIVACPRDCYDTCFLRIYEKSGKYFIEHLDIPYGFKIGCPRASKDFDRTFSKKRILYPQLANPKGTNKFRRIDWKTALELLTSKLKDVLDNYGPDKVLVIDYAGNRGLLIRYFSKRLWFYLRASFTNYNLCDYAGYFGIKLHYGSSYGANIRDVRNSKLFIY
ncbi:MAG: hypothetical protein DRN49_07265 [Thaumarchaeota archaeon]|nr:MAG: hypothetical protein DRN49_07265 [Nitrososphaerota archaeon]